MKMFLSHFTYKEVRGAIRNQKLWAEIYMKLVVRMKISKKI
jgi:hypothetical protein